MLTRIETSLMKLRKSIFGISCVLFGMMLLSGCQKQTKMTLPPVSHKTLTAMVISDDHVIAPSLHDNGKAFTQYAANDAGADLKYSATIFRAFIAKALISLTLCSSVAILLTTVKKPVTSTLPSSFADWMLSTSASTSSPVITTWTTPSPVASKESINIAPRRLARPSSIRSIIRPATAKPVKLTQAHWDIW